jgi:hypothetical protein
MPFDIDLATDTTTSGSIWQRRTGSSASCSIPVSSRDDPVIAMASSVDPTALNTDLGKTGGKRHCFKYGAPSCTFDVNQVQKLEFDLSMQNCADVWTSPLWMVPPAWGPTQAKSGEIDFVEACSGNINVSFGSNPGEYSPWPVPDKNNIKGRIQLLFDKHADIITSQICDEMGQNCKSGHVRHGYFADILHGSNPSGKSMTLISDIWNGYKGDGGFDGCAAGLNEDQRNKSTCNYTVSNIKFTPYPNQPPIFSGLCTALNASA